MVEKQFIILSKAWYSESSLKGADFIDEITFGLYGDTTVEACIKWYELNDCETPRVEVFSDAWSLFNECKDFFELLSSYNNKDLTVKEVANLLKQCGFKDNTPH